MRSARRSSLPAVPPACPWHRFRRGAHGQQRSPRNGRELGGWPGTRLACRPGRAFQARHPLGSLDGLPRNRRRDYCGYVPGRAGDACLPVGWLRLHQSGQGGCGAEPCSYRILGMHSHRPASRAAPPGYLAPSPRRLRRDRRAAPQAAPRTRPAARPQPGVPAQAGTRDRPVPTHRPRAATVLPGQGLAAFQVAQRRPVADRDAAQRR